MNTRPPDHLTVPELRALIRERGICKGSAVVSAPRATLLEALESGVWPEAPATAGQLAASPEAASQLAAALAALMPPAGLDEERVREIATECAQGAEDAAVAAAVAAVAALPPQTLLVKVAHLPEVKIERQHARFPLALLAAANAVNTLLVGPAGSGKTSVARAIARTLGLPFACQSVSPQTSKSDLLGFTDAGGTYRESLFVRCYRDGGVFLLDEIDAGNAGVLTVLNAAAAGDVLACPCGMVDRHPGFRLLAAANTYGQGASRQYVGRNQLDAATLDRFFMLDWPVDEGMEAAAVGLKRDGETIKLDHGGVPTDAEWFARVLAVRRAVESCGVRAVISPRATFAGVLLAAAGMGRRWLEEGLLWRGMDADARKRVETATGGGL
jgi:MoxR-like ATPase